jgi:RNA polymerase sigma factor (TIGR02999 family)
MDDHESREVSRILRSGEPDLEMLLPLVYERLREIARVRLRSERPDHTLSATALVHEAWLRLAGRDPVDWPTKARFYAAAAAAMRRILIDHARGRGRIKRGGGRGRLPLDVVELATKRDPAEILAVDDAVDRLEERDPMLAEVVKLRFFAGLSEEETAWVLERSARSVRRDWALARAWLQREFSS